jgi:hypothetical protein
MYLFNMWLELHDNQLSEQIIGFDEWVGLYDAWKNSDQGQKVLLSMESNAAPAGNDSQNTIH